MTCDTNTIQYIIELQNDTEYCTWYDQMVQSARIVFTLQKELGINTQPLLIVLKNAQTITGPLQNTTTNLLTPRHVK